MATFFFRNNKILEQGGEDFTFDENDIEDETIKVSSLGTPIVSNLVFADGSYTINNQTVNFEGIELDNVLVTINQSKNVVTTPVQGRNGTVKEFISDGDYIIKVTGYLFNDNDDTPPNRQIRILNEIFKAPISLSFRSEFLDKFGSFDLTITDYSFPQEAGFRNRQAFEFSALSDNPIELQLNAEANL